MIGERFWEVDFFKGVGIVMVMVYHFVFDLNFFSVVRTNPLVGFWWWFGRFSASVFLVAVGMNLVFSFEKHHSHWRSVRRGLKILGWGLVISVVTWFFLGDLFVRFGVLHFIGSVVLLSPLFLGLNDFLIGFLSLTVLFLFVLFTSVRVSSEWFLPLGLVPARFVSVDFYPLIPWLSLPLLGVLIARGFYLSGLRDEFLPDLSSNFFVRSVGFLGKRSLFLYLVHQPLFLLFFYLSGLI